MHWNNDLPWAILSPSWWICFQAACDVLHNVQQAEQKDFGRLTRYTNQPLRFVRGRTGYSSQGFLVEMLVLLPLWFVLLCFGRRIRTVASANVPYV